jgi:hypothetical protein
MKLTGVNLFAVLTAAVAALSLGILWYSRFLFGRPWMRFMGYAPDDPAQQRDMRRQAWQLYRLAFVASLLTAFVLGEVVRITTANTVLHGMKVGVSMWLGFVTTVQFTQKLFSCKPTKLYLIDTGYQLACFLVMGAMIAAWPRPRERLGADFGLVIFQQHCMACHGNSNAAQQAPDPATLRQLSPEAIYATLTTSCGSRLWWQKACRPRV